MSRYTKMTIDSVCPSYIVKFLIHCLGSCTKVLQILVSDRISGPFEKIFDISTVCLHLRSPQILQEEPDNHHCVSKPEDDVEQNRHKDSISKIKTYECQSLKSYLTLSTLL